MERETCPPLILAVIEQRQRGQVFVDEPRQPTSAVVITNFGFMSFIGAEVNEKFNAEVTDLLTTGRSLRPGYLLWYSPPIRWQKRLDVLVPDVVKRRQRMRFEFREERAGFLSRAVACPAGFDLEHLGLDLIPRTEKLNVGIESRFWSSAEDFCENGLGVCLLKQGEVVSLCYSACIAGGSAEIDIATLPEYRGRGFGELVAQQFIKECLSRAIIPAWDCFEGNIASVHLAEKLGFNRFRSYPFYSFSVPIELMETTP